MRVVVVCDFAPGLVDRVLSVYAGFAVKPEIILIRRRRGDVLSRVSRIVEIPLGVSLDVDPFRHPMRMLIDILRTIVYLAYIVLLLPIIAEDGPVDLVHAHFLLPQGLAGVLVARVMKAPLVLTAAGSDVNSFMTHLFPRALVRHVLFQSSQYVIAVSRPLFDMLKSMGCGNAVYIPNSVDIPKPLDRIAQHTRRQHGILFVGLLVPEKRPDVLIRAFSIVADQVAEATLTFAGTGPMSQYIERMASGLGLTERIRFAGFLQQEQLAELYWESSVFVLPSVKEGMSLAMLEAMSFGMCIIVSEPAQSGVIQDKMDGLVFRLDDVDDLAEKILLLFGNPEMMLTLSANALLKCRCEYSVSAVGPKLEELYREACATQS